MLPKKKQSPTKRNLTEKQLNSFCMFFNSIYHFCDRLEDKVRGRLSHYPIIYAFIGGAGIIIFWRGVWHTADSLMEFFFLTSASLSTTNGVGLPWWDGPLSIAIGTALLLLVGLFVTSFIGNEIIISGIKGEKKLAEKTEQEVKEDLTADTRLKRQNEEIIKRLDKIEKKLSVKN